MAVGSYAVFRDSAGSQTAGATFGALDFATEQSDSGNIVTRTSSGVFRFDEAGCFLILFNIRHIHDGIGTRGSCQAKVTYSGSGDFVSCYGSGYHRNGENTTAGITSAALVRNAAQNDTFSVEWRRGTDDNQSGTEVNDSYVTAIRLHDSPSVGFYRNATDTSSFNSQTWTAVPYATQVAENDTSSIQRQAGNDAFRLKKDALYLIGYCVNFDSATNRTQRITKLRNVTDSRDLQWSYGYGYMRNAENEYGSPYCLALWKNDGTDTDIEVQCQRGNANNTGGAVRDAGEDDGIFIIELPDIAEAFIGYDQTGNQDYSSTDLAIYTSRTTEHNDAAAFTRLGASMINCEKAMNVVVGGSVFGERSDTDSTRLLRGGRVRLNTTKQDLGADVNYLRGQQAAATYNICNNPWWVGAVVTDDELGINIVDEGADGGSSDTTTGNRVGIWTLNLSSLTPGVTLVADAGTWTWTGQAAGLLHGKMLDAGAGSWSWTGQEAGIGHSPVLSLDTGQWRWNGREATIIYGEVPDVVVAGMPRLPRRRRYIMPDGQVFDDPDRALFELNRQLEAQKAEPEPQTSLLRPRRPRTEVFEPRPEEIPPQPLQSPSMAPPLPLQEMHNRLMTLPQGYVDPNLVRLMLQRIDDEEAAMVLL